MKPDFKPSKIFWVDLEMTGLVPGADKILEVAAIVTDWDFQELATYEGVVKVDNTVIASRMLGDFWDKFPEVKKQLVAQNETGRSAEMVETELLEFLEQSIGFDQKILLAGNSIHQDRRFIELEWPKLNQKLHYRMLDVSAWKVVYENKLKKRFVKPEAHRALDDIRGSIDELKYYLTKR